MKLIVAQVEIVQLETSQVEHARRLINEGQYRQQVADLFNVSRATLYRAMERQRR